MTMVQRGFVKDTGATHYQRSGDVVLGDDWVAPDSAVEKELQVRRQRRGWFSLKTSPLTRKIIVFNLIALMILVVGILQLSSSRDSLIQQRADGMVNEVALIANVVEAQLPSVGPVNLATGDGADIPTTLDALSLGQGVKVAVFDQEGTVVGETMGGGEKVSADAASNTGSSTVISNVLDSIWTLVSAPFSTDFDVKGTTTEEELSLIVPEALADGAQVRTVIGTDHGMAFVAATPILANGTAVGVVAMASPSGELDALVRSERERVLQMFIVAILVSIGLSLVLASTIANPLADLAAAAELGRDKNSRRMNPGRIRIPDLTARPDEIGRLSGALSGMVNALYNRIDGNEQFAADVAHEIKNPLASLRSAVGTLRLVKRDDQRAQLLDVIEHDVRRLDRLVSDISNASRLDSELVKEEEEEFDLLKMLGNLNQYLGEDAKSKGVDYITDMPDRPITIHGLEARLAQVFVNLITNAISFCEDGDAIRVWARKRENRVLIVVEDTGPGIPDEALTKIFKRFYSQRPEEHFGNNSGLGLAISKQIVEAHGGVIWAENIRPTEADITSDPLGARFVVGLPV